jgi:phosphoribosylglycinamide formyltransferase-1
MNLLRIAVLVSGSGTNLQSLIDSCRSGYIPGEIALVISSSPSAYSLERASKENIESIVIQRKNFNSDKEFSEEILKEVRARKTDLICLAGFLKKLGKNIVSAYRNRIMNIHPALLPKFGGQGMYGIRVHEAVLKSGEKYSGCTVHFVDEEYDRGPIILQKKVEVRQDDTPQTLAERILTEEHRLYPEAVKLFAEGKIKP